MTAVPPGLGARVQYRERLWPQPRFSAIVDQVLAVDPEFRVRELGEMSRVVTVEGEYGAWIHVHGERLGARAMRCIGAVFMGDFATALDVLATVPEHFAAVEGLAYELMRNQHFDLARRPRQFLYEPPPGWHGLPAGMIANWYPGDFPANRSMIVVPPARFVDIDPPAALETAIAELTAGLSIEDQVRDTVASSCGATGTCVRVRGHVERSDAPIHRELAGFVVGTRVYQLRLETAALDRLDEARALFHAVASSFHPLPSHDEVQSGHAFSPRLELFDHWAG